MSRTPAEIGSVRFEAFTLDHSVVAPAAGYRITGGRRAILYGPYIAVADEIQRTQVAEVVKTVSEPAQPAR